MIASAATYAIAAVPAEAEPAKDCPLCPRLAGYRSKNAATYPDYFNGPAPWFGPEAAKLLIVGLAPGLHGANRTGRPFTGDYAGELLYGTLRKFGFARGSLRCEARRRASADRRDDFERRSLRAA